MISVDEALELVSSHAGPLSPQGLPVRDALGCVLAEAVRSPCDSPPFDRSLMDGIAVHADEARAGAKIHLASGKIPAGTVPAAELAHGRAMRILTGALLPVGADAVIPRECYRTERLPSGEESVVAIEGDVRSGDFLIRRGEFVQAGQTVLAEGTSLTAVSVALLLELGCREVPVVPPVQVSVLATGSELVDDEEPLQGGQIRNTNGPMLAALLATRGCRVRELGVAPDREPQLREAMRSALESPLTIVSGGVSVGDLDLVPEILESLGVQKVFHGVRMRPGKPIWFGVSASGGIVFGLPGNPLSVFAGFRILVMTAIARMQHKKALSCSGMPCPLASPLHMSCDREVFLPARERISADLKEHDAHRAIGFPIEPLPWRGSGDLWTLSQASGLIRLPAGEHRCAAGERVPYLRLDEEG